MGLALRDQCYHTYGDYLSWPENLRYELIDGIACLMAPAPTLEHQEVVGEIYFQLRQALAGKSCRVFVAPVNVRFPKADESDEQVDTVLQPEVLELTGETAVGVLPGVSVCWNDLVQRLPKPEY